MKEYWIRKVHRYLGVIIGIQLSFWTISGIYFTWNDIEKVRGEHLIRIVEDDINIQKGQLADLSQILESFRGLNPQIETVKSVELRLLLGQPVYEITYFNDAGKMYQLVNAQSGEFIPMLDEVTAVRLAKADFKDNVNVKSVELLETDSDHAEYRGRDLPIFRVAIDHPSDVNIYISAQRGTVTARRNSTWRIFDFLWMIHTMDYETRDNFNNTLIKAFSIFGLITVLSGFLLWGVSTSLFKRKSI